MNRREKILAAAFVLMLVAWQGPPIFTSLFIEPIASREAQIRKLESGINDKKIQERKLELATGQLKNWALRSLPPNATLAAAKYQNWLYDLAEKTKLANISAISNRAESRAVGDTYFVIGATVKGRGTLDQLCDFLYEFHQSGLLHRVNSVTIETARHEGNPPLDFTLVVEGLALLDSPPRTTLFANPSKPLVPDQPLKDRKDYALITAKNLFVKGYNGPPKPPELVRTDKPAEDKFDAGEFVYLCGRVESGDTQEVWLYDRSSGKRTVLLAGDQFSVAGVEGTLVAITEEFVTLEIKGETWELDLGSNLKQMRKVAQSPANEPAAAETAG